MTMTCREVQEQLTPFVDGALTDSDAHPLAAHLEACPGCRGLAESERAGRRLIQEHAPRLATPAPPSCHAKVRRVLPASRPVRFAWMAAATAAAFVVTLGAVMIAGMVRPVPVFAAQATLDHLKCLHVGPNMVSSDAAPLETMWRDRQGWELRVPTGQQGAGLHLIGCRTCVVTEGRVAHVFYERNGDVVSLFVLPKGPDVGHAELEMFGQDAVLWTSHGLTYALVGRGGRGVLTAAASSLEHELDARAEPAGSQIR
jgi:anti-sigma factor RsiW